MTAPRPEVTHIPRPAPSPIDPDSHAGKQAAAALAELFDDIADRLRREGKPVPDCIA